MSKTTMPTISVITVIYNGKSYLEKTIISVASQTYPKVEYIIIDGGSSDGTIDIIKKYSNNINYWISEPDNGIYDAMNKGVQAATGSWILFLNAGDTFFDDNTIEKFNSFLSKNSHNTPALIFGDVMLIYPNGSEEKRHLKNSNTFLIRNMICHQCIFYSDTLFKQVGLFNLNYKLAADFEHFTRIRWKKFKITKINTVISKYGLDGVSASRESIKQIWKERIRIFKEASYMPFIVRHLFWLYSKAAYEYRKKF
jgi:glycosyltransferase involved in cell wall biosynthesis